MMGWRLAGNVSFNTITDDSEGLYNDFNTPEYRFNLSAGKANVYRNIGVNAVYRWQDAFHLNSTFSAGEAPAFGTVTDQVSYLGPQPIVPVKLSGNHMVNQFYYNF